MTIDAIKSAFASRLTDFTGLGAAVKFDFGDDGAICIDANQAPPAFMAEDSEVDCTIRLTLENFKKLMAGTLNPTLAYTMGKLRVDGSLGIAMKIAARLED